MLVSPPSIEVFIQTPLSCCVCTLLPVAKAFFPSEHSDEGNSAASMFCKVVADTTEEMPYEWLPNVPPFFSSTEVSLSKSLATWFTLAELRSDWQQKTVAALRSLLLWMHCRWMGTLILRKNRQYTSIHFFQYIYGCWKRDVDEGSVASVWTIQGFLETPVKFLSSVVSM